MYLLCVPRRIRWQPRCKTLVSPSLLFYRYHCYCSLLLVLLLLFSHFKHKVKFLLEVENLCCWSTLEAGKILLNIWSIAQQNSCFHSIHILFDDGVNKDENRVAFHSFSLFSSHSHPHWQWIYCFPFSKLNISSSVVKTLSYGKYLSVRSMNSKDEPER